LKELRAAKGGALRVLFSFDPRRQAILLLGGDKSGEWNDWYEWAVPSPITCMRSTSGSSVRKA
jgi:hypothetical protein